MPSYGQVAVDPQRHQTLVALGREGVAGIFRQGTTSVITSIGIVLSANGFETATARKRFAQPPQNLSVGPFTEPQVEHAPGSPLPQPPQCLRQGSLSCWQERQVIGDAMSVGSTDLLRRKGKLE
jgi:hypothetical protein